MGDIRDHYKDTILRVLSKFQLLEFALKVYIGLGYKAVKARVDGVLHFDYTEADLDDLPLGRLLGLFRRLNASEELVKRMQALQAERNQIAHRSLLTTMGPLFDRGLVEDKHIEYSVLEDEVTECIQSVNDESRKLKARAQSSA